MQALTAECLVSRHLPLGSTLAFTKGSKITAADWENAGMVDASASDAPPQ